MEASRSASGTLFHTLKGTAVTDNPAMYDEEPTPHTVEQTSGDERSAIEQLTDKQLEALSSLAFVSNNDLRGISSYEEAVQLAEQIHGSVEDLAHEVGSGFSLLKDKARLCGEPFVILGFRFNHGSFGKHFVTVAAVTEHNDKVIFNDGSTGIRDQLAEYASRTRRFGGLIARNGLRASQYDTCPECGLPMTPDDEECKTCSYRGEKRARGETYYLDVTA